MGNALKKIKEYFSSNANVSAENEALRQEFLNKLMSAEAELSALKLSLGQAKANKDTEEIQSLQALITEKESGYRGLMLESLKSFPDLQKYTKELEKTKEITGNIGSVISGILDIAESNKQIKEGQRAQSMVKPFEPLKPFKRSELLQDQIRQTKQASTAGAIAQATGGLKSEIDNQFSSDVNAAGVTSGGQSGAFQSNSQAAARQRLKNLIQLQVQQQALRNQNDRNLNYLATQQIGENQAADVSERFRASQDWDRYQFETRNAAGLEQAGRQNQRNARNYALQQIPGIASMFVQPKMPTAPLPSNQRVSLNPVSLKSFHSVNPNSQGDFYGPSEPTPSMPTGLMSQNLMRRRNQVPNQVPRIDFNLDNSFSDIDKYLFNYSYSR